MRISRIVNKPIIINFPGFENCPKDSLLFTTNLRKQQKVEREYKHIKSINPSQQFNTNCINNSTQCIIIDTSHIGHAVVQRIKSKAATRAIKIAYL